ncbi:hypothetical protein UFOVP787_131 [uncultured Caudovirales phage]|uniref:Uncharacterized protein n=1 Tax=uncultured Caudovirales phage TaxID=2100421 RepID=A0A6J5NSS3_9CAUD|nr:hypothetical protein UFOVP787_131 [uncultured Caudovirales phage]
MVKTVSGYTFFKVPGTLTVNTVSANNSLGTTLDVLTSNSTGGVYWAPATANNANYLGTVAAANYVQNTDSRVLSGNLNFTGTNNYFSTAVFVGANISVNTTSLLIGNSIVNSVSNSSSFVITGNTTTLATATLSSSGLTVGNSSTTQTTSSISVANSTGNVQITAGTTSILATGQINAASHTVGTSFIANTTQVTISGIPLSANGSTGSATQLLTSNGSTGAPYWAAYTYVPGATSYTSTQTFAGNSSSFAQIITNSAETTNVAAVAANGTMTYYITNQSVMYLTTNAAANWTLNVAFSSATTLNTALATGQTVTIAFAVTQGATAYSSNSIFIDGSTVAPKWQNGIIPPLAGNPSGIDLYQYTIVKTGSSAYTVFASCTPYK